MVKSLFCSNEYQVDDRGFILSKKGKPLKPSVNKRGYEIVNLMINGERVGLAVHTGVARAFCDGFAENLQVNHKDGNKRNNSADNLEWVTPKENVRHAINELGFDNKEEKNYNSKAVVGINQYSREVMYSFPCVMTAGRHFSPNNEVRARHIENIICGIAGGYGNKHSYRNCLWYYV